MEIKEQFEMDVLELRHKCLRNKISSFSSVTRLVSWLFNNAITSDAEMING
jgi:hypothetical protein